MTLIKTRLNFISRAEVRARSSQLCIGASYGCVRECIAMCRFATLKIERKIADMMMRLVLLCWR